MALRLTEKSVLDISARLDDLDERDRNLVAMDLADVLEKYVDHGLLYYGDNRWVTDFVDNHGKLLIEMAERLGHPQLGAALRESFAASAIESVPDVLRSEGHVHNMELVVPRSCQLRLDLAATQT